MIFGNIWIKIDKVDRRQTCIMLLLTRCTVIWYMSTKPPPCRGPNLHLAHSLMGLRDNENCYIASTSRQVSLQ